MNFSISVINGIDIYREWMWRLLWVVWTLDNRKFSSVRAQDAFPFGSSLTLSAGFYRSPCASLSPPRLCLYLTTSLCYCKWNFLNFLSVLFVEQHNWSILGWFCILCWVPLLVLKVWQMLYNFLHLHPEIIYFFPPNLDALFSSLAPARTSSALWRRNSSGRRPAWFPI